GRPGAAFAPRAGRLVAGPSRAGGTLAPLFPCIRPRNGARPIQAGPPPAASAPFRWPPMKFRFPIVIIDEDFRSENASGLGIRALAAAIEAEGVEVLGVTSYGDLTSFAQQQSRASAFILSIDDEEFDVDSPEDVANAIKNLRAFIGELRFRNADIPIYLY